MIRVSIERAEHVQKHDRMEQIGVEEDRRNAIQGQTHWTGDHVEQGERKLNQLYRCHHSFDGQLLSQRWTESGAAVVRVHQNVNDRVKKDKQTIGSLVCKANRQPNSDWDTGMMKQVQKSDLSISFS